MSPGWRGDPLPATSRRLQYSVLPKWSSGSAVSLIPAVSCVHSWLPDALNPVLLP